MIRVQDLRLGFGREDVLEGVSLSVEPGEFVGLVGPNGAGKTTLLRAINGVLDPDGGTVTVDGDPVGTMPADVLGRRVATVPQRTGLDFAFSVREVVEMGRTPHRSRLDWGDGSDAVTAAMERTDVARFQDRPVADLSGGQRQQVLLARALAQGTPALLLDEPTANLDINHQVRVLDIVADLVAEGRTVIAAIHDLDLAARYCDRLCLLQDGHVRARGPPDAVLNAADLEAAFDTPVAVVPNPATGAPSVTALSARPDGDCRVHVLGGGQPGARALRALARAGCTATLGPVPDGDAAAVAADRLGWTAVTVAPFTDPVAGRDRAADLARAADVLLDTGGPGSERFGALARDHDRTVATDRVEDAVAAVVRETAATGADD